MSSSHHDPLYLPVHAPFFFVYSWQNHPVSFGWSLEVQLRTWFITKKWALWEWSKLKIAHKLVLKSLKIGKLVQFIWKLNFPAFMPFSLLGRTTSSFWWFCIFNNEFPMKSALRTRFYKLTVRIFILSSLPRKPVLNTVLQYDLTRSMKKGNL